MPYNHPNFNPKRNRWQTFSNLNRPCHLGILPSITQKNNDIFFSQAASVQSVMLASTRKASQRLRIESCRSVSYPSWTVSLHPCNLKSSFVSPTGNIKRWRSLNFQKETMINIYIYVYRCKSFILYHYSIYTSHTQISQFQSAKKHGPTTKPPMAELSGGAGPTSGPQRSQKAASSARSCSLDQPRPPNVPGPQKLRVG